MYHFGQQRFSSHLPLKEFSFNITLINVHPKTQIILKTFKTVIPHPVINGIRVIFVYLNCDLLLIQTAHQHKTNYSTIYF